MERGNKWSNERLEKVGHLIRKLYVVVEELNEEFASERRKFTPDGHMVGNLGEVVASYSYDLQLLPASTEGHDAKTRDGKLVQIKLTGGKRSIGLYSKPKYLIVLQLGDKGFKVVYNGPGATAWGKCGKRQKNGQRSISLSTLRELNTQASPKIQQIREFPWTGPTTRRPTMI